MKKLIILIIFTLFLIACAVEEPVLKNSEDAVNASITAPPTQEDIRALPEQASVIIKTNKGDISIELLPKSAPLTVANFLNLTKAGFYNGVKFHRVIPDFMIQTGDPKSKDENWYDDGTGGPGYYFADEVSFDDQLVRGTVAMANAGPNTNGSQFFIVTAEAVPWLNGRHTIFGKIIEGMEVVDAIEQVRTTGEQGQPPNHPVKDVVIEEVR
ncbi:MAG: peptidylprolyl isomerase [Patescibacteria group bacterium]